MAINSVKSNALEPTSAELAQLSLGGKVARLLPVYGLVVLAVLLAGSGLRLKHHKEEFD